jgi:nucleoid-associated protein YgaU
MVAVVVIILSVVVTSGGRDGADPLSPVSHGAKTSAMLEVSNRVEPTQPAPRPDPGRNLVNTIFNDKDETDRPNPALGLNHPSEADKVAPKPAPKPAYRSHKISRGDTLGHIARKYLGRASRWREIAKLNPKLNPNNLKLGETIKIPPK